MKSIYEGYAPVVHKGFVLNLYEDLRPLHRLNPFTTAQAAAFRDDTGDSSAIDTILAERFDNRPFVYTINGRQAIREALRLLRLVPSDCVTILTSTGNSYISGCVTTEISAFCQWSMAIEPNTKAVFVNHEFGVPYPGLADLKDLGLPIIEDCCYAFNSGTADNQVERIGDYLLFSFAKYFPLQFGGLLVGPAGQSLPTNLQDAKADDYLRRALLKLYPEINEIAAQRRRNHAELAHRVAPLGLLPRFDFTSEGAPGVFMFTAPSAWDLPALKDFMWANGINCSVFYGEQAFFIPVHQSLKPEDFDYFNVCLEYFAALHNLTI